MINNFCSCYDYVLICEKCFINWIFKNNNCFICRKKFVNDTNSRFKIFDIRIDSLYNKILIKIEEMYIPRDNLEIHRNTNHFINNENRVLSFYARNMDIINDYPYIFFCFVILIGISIFCITQYFYYLS